MPRTFRISLSPYHLSSREAPAMASLLLADQVFTLRPGHASGAARVASRASASYRDLMRSWSWSEDLWREGVLSSEFDGEAALDDVRHIHETIAADDRFTPLRTFLHEDLLDEERRYLEALAADVLKGGPDPGISVPIVAGLDRFAGRHGLTVARAHPTSIAEKSEWAIAADRIAIGIPIFLQADAERLLLARALLLDVLKPLRIALAARSRGATPEADQAVHFAAEKYAAAFDNRRTDLFDHSSTDEVRAVEGAVTVSCFRLPADAVLTSSLSAFEALRGPVSRRNSPRSESRSVTEQPQPGLVLSAGAPIAAIAFKPLGRR